MWHNRIKCDIMHPLAVQTQPNGKTERQKCYKRLFTKCPYEKDESKSKRFFFNIATSSAFPAYYGRNGHWRAKMGKKRGEGAKTGEQRRSELALGASARITGLQASGELRRRLVELGFFEGERAVKVLESPLGDPSGYLVCGAVTAIRNADAACYASAELKRRTLAARRAAEKMRYESSRIDERRHRKGDGIFYMYRMEKLIRVERYPLLQKRVEKHYRRAARRQKEYKPRMTFAQLPRNMEGIMEGGSY